MKNTLPFLLVWLLPAVLSAQQGDNNKQTVLIFTHVTVIDATGAPAKPDMTVVVRGDRIEALGKTGKLVIPQDGQVVDATGKFLIPGLWDMHVHPWLGKNYLALFTANGVTGIRVMAGEPEHHEWRKEISAGKLIGPRMVISSPVVDGPKPAHGSFIVVSSEDEGRQVVRKYKKEGADLIKVYHFLPRDAYFAIADEAKKQGIPFAGHVPLSVRVAEASDAGQQSIEHIAFVSMACSTEGEEELKKKVKETVVTRPFSLPHMRARYKLRAIPYSEKKAAELFARFVKNSTWACPTLILKHGMLFHDGEDFTNDPRLKYMPLSTRDSWNPKNNDIFAFATGEGRADFRKLCEKDLAIVGEMRRAGVGLLAGTDTTGMVLSPYVFPGFGLHDELVLFVQAGLSPMEALQTATYNPAKFLGKLDSMGTVEQGKIADLVLLDANPLQDINNTQKIAAVVAGGRIFHRAALQKMLAQVEAQDDISPLHFALYMKDEAKARSLIEGGADVSRRTSQGTTPLSRAVDAGFKDIVELLIAKGADVNAKDNWNWTPLHSAVYGHKDIVELLITEGANVNARDGASRTPLFYAKDEGNSEIVELLRKHGAKE